MARGFSSSQVKIGWMHYYFVWYTWKGKPLLKERIGWRCKELIERQIRLMNCEVRAIEVNDDYVYLGIKTKPLLSPHETISKIKGFTSSMLRQEFPDIRKSPSLWNRSYFVSTYGRQPAADIKQYSKYMSKQRKKYRKYIKKRNGLAREDKLSEN